jgi:hypothetical protein
MAFGRGWRVAPFIRLLAAIALAGCGDSEIVDESAQGALDAESDAPESATHDVTHEAASSKQDASEVVDSSPVDDAAGNTPVDAVADVIVEATLDVGREAIADVAVEAKGDSATDASAVDVVTIEAAPDVNPVDATADASADAGQDAKLADAGLDGDACVGDTCGSIVIGINVCPEITGYTINPITVNVGEAVHLTSSATDGNGDPLTFLWTATQGAFTNANSPNTDFHCTSPGTATLTLTVSDGICDDGIDQNVTCL